MTVDKYKDNFRPDGKRWACPYCGKGIEGLFEMGVHLESHKKATHFEIDTKRGYKLLKNKDGSIEYEPEPTYDPYPDSELIGYFRVDEDDKNDQ